MEDEFGKIERKVAPIIRKLDSGIIPKRMSASYIELILFVAIQQGRTRAAAEMDEESVNRFFSLAWKGTEEGAALASEKIRIGSTLPSATPLLGAMRAIPLFGDLRPVIIKAKGEAKFITSDNPVVLYNVYLEEALRLGIGALGLVRAGIMVFFPISPDTLLMLADAGVYKFGGKKAASIVTADDKDVTQLNRLQWVNAGHNIFFKEAANENHLRHYADGVRELRKFLEPLVMELVHVGNEKFIRREYLSPDHNSEGERTIIHKTMSYPNLNLKLSFLSFRRAASRRRSATSLSDRALELRRGWGWEELERLKEWWDKGVLGL